MTPYTRRMAAALAVGATIAAAGAITHPSGAAATPPDVIAPGGNITAVVQATALMGWPHPPQRSEMRAIARLALWYGITSYYGDHGRVACRFGPAMGRARCRVVKLTSDGTRARFDISFSVFEDGSYRTTFAVVR